MVVVIEARATSNCSTNDNRDSNGGARSKTADTGCSGSSSEFILTNHEELVTELCHNLSHFSRIISQFILQSVTEICHSL